MNPTDRLRALALRLWTAIPAPAPPKPKAPRKPRAKAVDKPATAP